MSHIFKNLVPVNVSLAREFEGLIANPPSSTGSIALQEVKVLFTDGKIFADLGARNHMQRRLVIVQPEIS